MSGRRRAGQGCVYQPHSRSYTTIRHAAVVPRAVMVVVHLKIS